MKYSFLQNTKNSVMTKEKSCIYGMIIISLK